MNSCKIRTRKQDLSYLLTKFSVSVGCTQVVRPVPGAILIKDYLTTTDKDKWQRLQIKA